MRSIPDKAAKATHRGHASTNNDSSGGGGTLMTRRSIGRRRFVASTAALSSAMVAAPFVRGAYAAGKLAIGLWDHWVPGANKGAEAVAMAWAEKEKVDLQIDFITSQGNKLILTGAAEAQARSGHDIL